MKKIRNQDSEKVWDYENGFYWFSANSRINKLLAHYEIYKTILNIPGHIVELGVYKGVSLVRFATFRDALENDYSRKIIGFDIFGDFPTDKLQLDGDLRFIEKFECTGGKGLSHDEIMEILNFKKFENISLIKGNIFDSLPEYVAEFPETRIALLHIDLDVKEPTEFALELLWDRLVPGGVIVFDDYNGVVGATMSVDKFVAKHQLKLKKLTFYSAPAFIRKPV